jgi:hypothetical protein
VAGLGQFGLWGVLSALVLMAIRTLLIAYVTVWSLKADKAGRTHALALLRLLSFRTRARDRSP